MVKNNCLQIPRLEEFININTKLSYVFRHYFLTYFSYIVIPWLFSFCQLLSPLICVLFPHYLHLHIFHNFLTRFLLLNSRQIYLSSKIINLKKMFCLDTKLNIGQLQAVMIKLRAKKWTWPNLTSNSLVARVHCPCS